jgi:hypothetical protein
MSLIDAPSVHLHYIDAHIYYINEQTRKSIENDKNQNGGRELRRGRRVKRSRSENKIRGKIDPNQKTIQINMQSGSYRRSYACGFIKNLK